jgi:hypothetical protein
MNTKDEALLRSYRLCFGSPAGREVLHDLMQVCRFRVPLSPDVDTNHLLMAEGARIVFLRIVSMLKLDLDATLNVAAGERFNLEEDQDAA